jgi:hypothetical protein
MCEHPSDAVKNLSFDLSTKRHRQQGAPSIGASKSIDGGLDWESAEEPPQERESTNRFGTFSKQPLSLL